MIAAILALSAADPAPAAPKVPPLPMADEILEPERAPAPDPYLLTLGVLLPRAERMLERTTRESVQRAAELYRFALQIDASSAEARAGTARAMTPR